MPLHFGVKGYRESLPELPSLLDLTSVPPTRAELTTLVSWVLSSIPLRHRQFWLPAPTNPSKYYSENSLLSKKLARESHLSSLFNFSIFFNGIDPNRYYFSHEFETLTEPQRQKVVVAEAFYACLLERRLRSSYALRTWEERFLLTKLQLILTSLWAQPASIQPSPFNT